MRQRFTEVTGFVLAGGASRRMGRPKEALAFGPETLIERQVRRLRTVCRSVMVIGAPASAPAGVRIFPDAIPGHGPLGGIVTALQHTPTEYNLVLGCDLPLVSARCLRYLSERALESRAFVTLPFTPGRGFQPLCAVYRREARAAIAAALNDGRNKVTSFYRHVRVCRVGWPELARAGFTPHIFSNLNTPSDYAAASRRVSSLTAVAARLPGSA